MSNPRYPRHQQGQQPLSPPSELDQLGQILSLTQPLQAQQQADQHQKLSTILQLLGLQQQQQHGDASLALQQQEANDLSGYRQGELGLKKQEIASHDDILKKEALHQVFSHLLADPSLGMDQKAAMVQNMMPEFAPAFAAMHQAGVQNQIQKTAPLFAGAYQGNGTHLDKLRSTLDAFKQTMSPEVFNGQDWGALNSSLPAGNTSTSLWSRMFGGGTAGPTGSTPTTPTSPSPQQTTPNYDAQGNFIGNIPVPQPFFDWHKLFQLPAIGQ